jgi:acyl carrier protein
METSREQILGLLYESIDELNEQLDQGQRLSKSPETPLLGDGGGLDSLGFVNLVALVEEKCCERLGATLVLTEGGSIPDARNPFETVGTLAAHIELALAAKRATKR